MMRATADVALLDGAHKRKSNPFGSSGSQLGASVQTLIATKTMLNPVAK